MNCKVPNCKHAATTTWATVPVCEMHYDVIDYEHEQYYKAYQDERVVYNRIKHLVPFEDMRQ
ncbi:hypothetical protein PPOP_2225 [Paenibacillus popilliae ATCC 14706]|uniref:Uncharacterized protein n=1 Tax=Paenibacillus popilliae ATCC 14706 TaxID=1212764 RepID=M9LIF9_PAEPP|nr:hypothetical protein PPOP_2225 [Paenibacillus popilliae ATCC 14706]